MGQDQDARRGAVDGARMAPSQRSMVEPFLVMDVMRAAIDRESAGDPVIHMEVGQPGAPAPQKVIAAAQAALCDGHLGYTESLGTRALRGRIARHYGEAYGIDLPPERVAVTTGSSAGFVLAFLAAFDPGDRVALGTPGYPAYSNILSALGLEVVELETGPETRYTPTPDMLAAAHAEQPLSGLLVASPANPTGTVVPPDALGALIAAADSKPNSSIQDRGWHFGRYAVATLIVGLTVLFALSDCIVQKRRIQGRQQQIPRS